MRNCMRPGQWGFQACHNKCHRVRSCANPAPLAHENVPSNDTKIIQNLRSAKYCQVWIVSQCFSDPSWWLNELAMRKVFMLAIFYGVLLNDNLQRAGSNFTCLLDIEKVRGKNTKHTPFGLKFLKNPCVTEIWILLQVLSGEQRRFIERMLKRTSHRNWFKPLLQIPGWMDGWMDR